MRNLHPDNFPFLYKQCRNKFVFIFYWECTIFTLYLGTIKNLFTSSNLYISYKVFNFEKYIIHIKLYWFSFYKLKNTWFFLSKSRKNCIYSPQVQHNSRLLRSVDQSKLYAGCIWIMLATSGVSFIFLNLLVWDIQYIKIWKLEKYYLYE